MEFKSNVSYIYDKAFFNCYSLASITIPCTFDKDVFSNNDTGINADRSSDNFYVSGDYSGSSEYTFNYSHQNENSDVVLSGSCGEQAQYALTCDGVLKITGKGDMYNYHNKYIPYNSYNPDYGYTPWKGYEKDIKSIVIDNGITNIGSYAFYDCSYVTSVQIAESVTDIGNYAFYNVGRYGGYDSYGNYTGFSYLTLPSKLYSIGEAAFQNCPISTLEFTEKLFHERVV